MQLYHRYRIQPVLMDENRNEIEGNQVVGSLCIKFPWPGIARTIWGDHQRYKDTYFSAFPELISPATGLYEMVGYYRITGRVDVVIVSGHNLGLTLLRMPLMSILQLPSYCWFST
jgi:acetyl-CoA synthetase